MFSAFKGRTLNDNRNNSPSGQFLISFVVKKEIWQVWVAAMIKALGLESCRFQVNFQTSEPLRVDPNQAFSLLTQLKSELFL